MSSTETKEPKEAKKRKQGPRRKGCPHGNGSMNRCHECRHEYNRGKCSSCGAEITVDGNAVYNRQELRRCKVCRWTCEHDIKTWGGKQNCQLCKYERREQSNEWRRKKKCIHNKCYGRCMVCHPSNHLISNTRSRISAIIKKEQHTVEYLGCDADFFRKHLESKFQEGMTLENYGLWHIDHIIPLKYPGATGEEPTLEEIKTRFHYTNTQPLWAKDNIMKGHHWIGKEKPETKISGTCDHNKLMDRCNVCNPCKYCARNGKPVANSYGHRAALNHQIRVMIADRIRKMEDDCQASMNALIQKIEELRINLERNGGQNNVVADS